MQMEKWCSRCALYWGKLRLQTVVTTQSDDAFALLTELAVLLGVVAAAHVERAVGGVGAAGVAAAAGEKKAENIR